jgi:hypothetical protein
LIHRPDQPQNLRHFLSRQVAADARVLSEGRITADADRRRRTDDCRVLTGEWQPFRPAEQLPTEAFAKEWLSFVMQAAHPVTMPP